MMVELQAVDQVLKGAEKVRDAGYRRWDVHTPFPVHGLNEAMGLRLSRLPWITFGAGATGAAVAILMQWWMNAVDYKVIVAGKPFFSLPAFIPIAFEVTILFAALATFFGMLVRNGLPTFYRPHFRSKRFQRATSDRFFIVIEAQDPLFDRNRTGALLESLGGPVEELED
jgi:hypothetical protein